MSKNSFAATRSAVTNLTTSMLSNSTGFGQSPVPLASQGSAQRMTTSRLTAILNEAIALIDDDDFCDEDEE